MTYRWCEHLECGEDATRVQRVTFPSSQRAFVFPAHEMDVRHCDAHEQWAKERVKDNIRIVVARSKGEA